ncbi:MAG TPA: TonB-dependent receptor [bacterium]|nr:TonB-dependent receptor [bacterium]
MYFEERMKKIIRLSSLVLLSICVLVSVDFLYAKDTGVIQGRVVDANSGEYLPGANVVCENIQAGCASDKSGRIYISNLPFGTHKITATYIGYKKFSTEITLSEENPKLNMNIEMEPEQIRMGEILVTGMRVGQTRALNEQKSSEKIVNVVNEEQIGLFPDVNTAEALQRVPGIALARDQGEGRYALVRGTSSRLNSTTINGASVSTPESDMRALALDVMSADALESIEVTKAITPDMSGASIGGSINLNTKSALDYPGKILKSSLKGGFNEMSGKGVYQADLTYGDQFGENNNIGLLLNGSFNRTNRASENNEMDWGYYEDQNFWAPEEMELRHYEIVRDRLTLSANMDYQPNDKSHFYFNTLYNYYSDVEHSRRQNMEADEDLTSQTHIPVAVFGTELKDRTQNQTMTNFSAGGEHKWSGLELDYSIAYSYADEQEPDKLTIEYEMDEEPAVNLDLSDRDNPKWNLEGLASGYNWDPKNYALDKIAADTTKTTDQTYSGQINFKLPYFIGDRRASAKFGLKEEYKSKDREETVWEYGYEGDGDFLLSEFPDDLSGKILDGNYSAPLSPQPQDIRDWFVDKRGGPLLESEINYEDSYVADYDASENVFAYYGMTTVHMGNVMLLGGFRHELTKFDYTGYDIVFDEEGDFDGTSENSNTENFSHILPMMHVKYSPSKNTNLRAAVTTGIARPDYETLVPFRLIIREDEEIEAGNPELVPTTSINFDLLGEHYLKGIGLLSGGIFAKRMDKIIFPYQEEIVDPGSEYNGWDRETWVQGETADLYGFEVHWQQQLTFLPGLLSNFGLYMNYTYTTSSATVGEREDLPLAGQAENVANFALSYQQGGFNGRVSMNYNGAHLSELGEEEAEDIYYDEHIQWDLSANQQLTDQLQFFIQAINMNNSYLRYYKGVINRPIQREFYSWWMTAGVKFNL